ncbi:chitin-binding protein, partial [Ralstonia pseudosolanacearum]
MTRALTLCALLCALVLTGCERRPSGPPTPQTSQTAQAAGLARAAAEFKCPAPS